MRCALSVVLQRLCLTAEQRSWATDAICTDTEKSPCASPQTKTTRPSRPPVHTPTEQLQLYSEILQHAVVAPALRQGGPWTQLPGRRARAAVARSRALVHVFLRPSQLNQTSELQNVQLRRLVERASAASLTVLGVVDDVDDVILVHE